MSVDVMRKLQLRTLGDLEPGLEIKFEQICASLVQDCLNRPGEDGKRKLTVTLEMVPIKDPGDGQCDDVGLTIHVKGSQPLFRTKEFRLIPDGKGGLKFNSDFPDEPRSRALPGMGFQEAPRIDPLEAEEEDEE